MDLNNLTGQTANVDAEIRLKVIFISKDQNDSIELIGESCSFSAQNKDHDRTPESACLGITLKRVGLQKVG